MDKYQIVIGIPTFRRPQLLEQLLFSLLPELSSLSQMHGQSIHIIVADNDCGTEVPAVVDNFQIHWDAIECLPVFERGVAQVRNAIVEKASPHRWDWLIMLDDDGIVTPGWMSHLISCGEEFQADLVGGPVEGILPKDAGIFARNSIFSSRRRWPTGPVETLNTTQNLAISKSLLELLQVPLFHARFGASGGEDYDLFRRTAAASGKLVWCDEAVVFEPAPIERLQFASLLSRYYTTGAYMARIDQAYDGTWKSSMIAIKGLAGAFFGVGIAVIRGRSNEMARSILSISHYTGRICGLLGAQTSRYVSLTGAH